MGFFGEGCSRWKTVTRPGRVETGARAFRDDRGHAVIMKLQACVACIGEDTGRKQQTAPLGGGNRT